jgi:hypothetical protein
MTKSAERDRGVRTAASTWPSLDIESNITDQSLRWFQQRYDGIWSGPLTALTPLALSIQPSQFVGMRNQLMQTATIPFALVAGSGAHIYAGHPITLLLRPYTSRREVGDPPQNRTHSLISPPLGFRTVLILRVRWWKRSLTVCIIA